MLLLILGLFIGSFTSLVIMGILMAAKRADQKIEAHFNQEAHFTKESVLS